MAKRVALNAAGWALLLLGILGLFLPVLPGVLLMVVALSLLSIEYAWARRWMGSLLHRFPATEKRFQEFLARHKKAASADAST
jgi:uncharacterized membrane protein YbaN (DUF454 family)